MSSKHRKGSKTPVQVNSGQSTTGELTEKEMISLMKEASPDDPIYTGGWLIGVMMDDIELIKDFWISLRAEEIAKENAAPEGDKQALWLAFEDAHIGADLEWHANYEGEDLDIENKDPNSVSACFSAFRQNGSALP